jgi:hypothetical protein
MVMDEAYFLYSTVVIQPGVGGRLWDRDSVVDVNEEGKQKVALSQKVTSSVWGALFLFLSHRNCLIVIFHILSL